MKQNLTIAVDFDGTCVKHAYPLIGGDIGAAPSLKYLVEQGARLILYTMRSGPTLSAAVDWFKANEIQLFGINENPEQSYWTESPKVYAHLYIDDAALNAPLTYPISGERPFIDWGRTQLLLEYFIEDWKAS